MVFTWCSTALRPLIAHSRPSCSCLQSARQLQGTLRSVGAALGNEEQVARPSAVGVAGAAAGARATTMGALQDSQRKVALLEAMVTALRERLEVEEETSSGLAEKVWERGCVGVKWL
eukprot:364271-Chlamydomonas_euryale.AAC.15